jgi:cytochrome c oxidase assembly protein subunit 15
MGCPDWPACFGRWVPPTSLEELPQNYREFYSTYRHQKNERFAVYLRALGFDETADALLNDPAVRVEPVFNPLKTWTEYVNRLVGVGVGICIILVFASSLRLWKTHRGITLWSAAALVLVIFQGWIGSIVVSTNLTPWVITVHMLIALALVALLIYLWVISSERASPYKENTSLRSWLIISMIFLLIQVVLGTQVREAIDAAVAMAVPREDWTSQAGVTFLIHRSFSWAVLLVHGIAWLKLRKEAEFRSFRIPFILLLLSALITGAGMGWFAVPAWLQPLHLLLATLTFGIQSMLIMQISSGKTQKQFPI